jgi:uncharacterized membrane-anchored protein YhcB (DUF1043 family)|tara:strand:+ start:555 stop:698 length:144 start_codon:yes stop_codon:yes gene_type:complete
MISLIITGVVGIVVGFVVGSLTAANNKDTVDRAIDLGKEIGQVDKKK